jgi:predicted nucleotidyltransferase
MVTPDASNKLLSQFAPVSKESLAEFCRRWLVAELALFGSVLRDDFGPESDVDVLVTFAPDADWSLFDHVKMAEELKALFKREVDLVSRRAVERSQNWIRRRSILNSAQVVYAARQR